MIIAMQEAVDEAQIQKVIDHLVNLGFEVHRSTGARQTVLGAVGRASNSICRSWNCCPECRAFIASVLPTSWREEVFAPKEPW